MIVQLILEMPYLTFVCILRNSKSPRATGGAVTVQLTQVRVRMALGNNNLDVVAEPVAHRKTAGQSRRGALHKLAQKEDQEENDPYAGPGITDDFMWCSSI